MVRFVRSISARDLAKKRLIEQLPELCIFSSLYFAVWFFSILLNFAPSPVALAQEQEKPAIAPIPRTINLTQEHDVSQRITLLEQEDEIQTMARWAKEKINQNE